MRSKKFLFVPGNSSLSHIVKCLAIMELLVQKGHSALIAVNKKHSRFLKNLNIKHFVLPDLQESDGSGFPTVDWFKRPQGIIDCIKAEVACLKKYQPDRILGVFRFTLQTSAKIVGIPYDSLICGCMIPESQEVLGFADCDPGKETQKIILDGFYRYAGAKMSVANKTYGIAPVKDIRDALKGDRTFLWDFPEFAPLPQPQDKNIIHTGPIYWNKWSDDRFNPDTIITDFNRLALIAFGTTKTNWAAVKRIARILRDLKYKVIIACGGQKDVFNEMQNTAQVVAYKYAPLHQIFPYAALAILHGGQMTVFEALANKTPVMVMPFQPEQSHNGLCLERIGCGRRLIPPQIFQGNPDVYLKALNRMTDDEIKSAINDLVNNPQTATRLAKIKGVMEQYKGVEKIVTSLEEF